MANFVITGGNSGIGAAIKQQMIDEGHSVIVVDITAADIQADLSTEQGRQLAVASIRKQCAAGLDGPVACAGSAPTAPPKLTTSLKYYGSKQVLVRWMRRNICSYAADGIRINAIAPGYIQTPMTQKIEDDPVYAAPINAFRGSTPTGRAGRPEEIVNLTRFLFSTAVSFICGSVLFIDGGHDAMLRPDQF